MKKPITVLLVMVFFFMLFSLFYSFAEERITLTTYYPAPYGVYSEMRADKMSIGSGYRNTALYDGLLIVNGSVGIGTTSPTQQLEVTKNILLPYASGNTVGNLFFGGDTSAGANGLRLFAFNGEGAYIDAKIGAGLTIDGLYFRVDNTDGGTERMRITAQGRVGIGTTNPQAKLEVNGDAKISGNLTAGNYMHNTATYEGHIHHGAGQPNYPKASVPFIVESIGTQTGPGYEPNNYITCPEGKFVCGARIRYYDCDQATGDCMTLDLKCC